MSVQSDATAGYLFIQKDMSKHVGGLGAFSIAGAGWAQSAHHYLVAIIVGATAWLLVILAICAETSGKHVYKHLALAVALVLSIAVGLKVNEIANKPDPHAVTTPLPTVPSVINNDANSNQDYAPAIAGSPGASVIYNVSPPPKTPSTKKKK